MDRNQSQLVALLTRASHSSVVLMSSSLAGEMQTGAITAQDEAYLPRKKTPNLILCLTNGITSSQFLTGGKSLLILLQFSTGVFFWVSELRRVHC